ncbi:MAG TPA: TetR family transcriptional regulator [Hungateiclostridium thermocellum]|jgi:probable dihydroxyacetone kinase regulator|nr:TetR/AcrR family transcriptional regulator C-terminal domain-containing protein [Acetivibrio thermocellus]CDG37131.1 transcriptional regulator, TetR family [Acetivibrio thermocellus BC1]ADU73350.1 regulatory protein TetR [Acetivibrio thermocellus DSM 1313]ALX07268.1 transcriptional regulator, TetR family [Acetivibrio thermocellus AD2]ANV75004.1 transcriptional regulator, TetR family [Acetivibrio thermocellus DSM 2360]EIC04267.1 regulatory protein TetR [Acetivibrio thermocellus YS]
MMAKPELTKQLIAQTLKKLMLNTPLDKISVQEIVDACGLNRKTFYYHFRDKQDLVCWIFDTEFASLTDANHNNSVLDELVEHLYKNRDFYVAALTSNVQNNLSEHFFRIIYESVREKAQEVLGENKIAPAEFDMIVNYFANAIVGTITQWARDGMKSPPYEYSTSFYPLTEECLRFIVEKRAEKRK